MKKLLTTIFAVSTLFIFSQTPQGINYQSIIRSTGGIVLPNTAVNMEFKLYNGLAGALVYHESHSTTTNSFGMANLIIGQGSPISGTFNTITWSNGIAYEVYVNSILIGTKQLFMSVPYALHAGSAPAPIVTFTNNVLSVGGNTTAISSGVTYTAGNGINFSGSVISGTANIIGTGATSVTGIYPNLTINTPTVQSYSAGNGINIDGAGVITNIAPPAPAYTLTTNSNSITINNGTSVSTATVPSYSAGNGINVSSTGVITNTASSTSLPAAFNGQFLYYNNGASKWDTIPQDRLFYDETNNMFGIGTKTPSSDLHVNGAGRFNSSVTTPQIYANAIQLSVATFTNAGDVLTNDGAGNGTWQTLPNYSLTQSGANIDLTQNGTSVATVTLTAATSTSLSAGSSNILLNQSGNAYTITPVTPIFTNAGPTTITGTYPNYTINSVSTASTTLVQGNNISLNQSANTYTVSAPGYSISLPGGNTVQITNGTNTSTAAIASTSLTLTGANTNILSAGGNTVALNTYTAGTGISVTGIAPNFVINNTATAITPTITGIGMASVTPIGNTFTVSVPSPSYTSNTGVLSFGGTNTVVASPSLSILGNVLRSGAITNTVTLPPAVITGTGTGIATVTTSVNNFTVNVPSPTYTPATGILSFGGTNTVIVTPTLALTGTTLTSGVATNSVNLSALNNWSVTSGVIYPATLTNSVGIGTSSLLGGRFEILHTATQANPTMHLRETTGGLNRIKFSNNTVANKFFETAAQTNAVDANGAYSINYFDGTTYKPVLLVTGEKKVNINNLNTVLASLHVMENASTAGGGVVSEGFARPGQMIIARNNQPALAARTAIIAGDEIGKLSFSGYNGAGFNDGGIISVISTEAYTGSSGGGNMVFRVTPTGTINTQDIFKLGGDGNVIVNPNNSFSKTLLDVRGRLRVDSSLTMAAYSTPPNTSFVNEGRIYYDRPSNKFKVSENGGAYVNLIGGGTSPWLQGAGVVSLNNINDQVGIGTNTPGSLLDIRSTATSTLITAPILNISNTHNTYATPTGMVNIENLAGTGDALYVKNSANGGGITTVLTNTTSNGTGISSTVNGLGNAGYFQVNNVNSNAKTIEAYNNGGSNTIHSINTGSTTGAAGYFQINNANSNGVAVDAYSNSNNGAIRGFSNGSGNAGTFNINNTSSTANALFAGSNANTFALRSIHTGTGSGAAIFDVIDPLNSNNTMEVYNSGIGTSIFANNTSSTNAAARFTNTGQGMALSVENTSNTDPTAYISNNGSYHALSAFSASGTAVYAQSNGLNHAISATNYGTGNSIDAYKSNTTSSGNVANFANNSTSNSADAVFVRNDGAGAAIHAVSGPTVVGSANLAFMVENGHIGSMASSNITVSFSTTCGCVTSITADAHSTDVAGTLRAVVSSSTSLDIDYNVTFTKPYKKYPVVIITTGSIPFPINNFPKYLVTPIGGAGNYTGFKLTILGGSINIGSGTPYLFNYMIIEGKN